MLPTCVLRTTEAGSRFESQHLLADGAQCFLFLAQDIPCFLAGDLAHAHPLDHAPELSTVFVGPFLEGVRRMRNYWIGLHFLVIINGQPDMELRDVSPLLCSFLSTESSLPVTKIVSAAEFDRRFDDGESILP